MHALSRTYSEATTTGGQSDNEHFLGSLRRHHRGHELRWGASPLHTQGYKLNKHYVLSLVAGGGKAARTARLGQELRVLHQLQPLPPPGAIPRYKKKAA